MSIRKYCKTLFFCLTTAVFLTGCFGDDRVAPVVNAWYQQGAASDFYIVQSDDTIYSIAFAFGLDYRALAKANNLMPPYPLTPGQRLVMITERPAEQKPKQTTVPSEKPVVVASSPAPAALPSKAPVTKQVTTQWEWPTKGRLIQGFSTSPSGHRGISIGGRVGQPIRAANNGVVVYSGDGVRGYGNLIIVKHNDTYLSAYAFNEQNRVVTGDRVHAGQVIAMMGQNDAGRAQLYFEIRQNGVPIDPLKFFYR